MCRCYYYAFSVDLCSSRRGIKAPHEVYFVREQNDKNIKGPPVNAL